MTTTILNTKIEEVENKVLHHPKYPTEFITLTTENFAARLKLANLLRKTDFDNELINFDRKIFRSSKKKQKKLNSQATNGYSLYRS